MNRPATEPTAVYPTLSTGSPVPPLGPPVPPGAPVGPPPPPKKKTGLVLGIIGGVLALCLIGGCVGVGGWFLLRDKSEPVAHTSTSPYETSYPYPSDSYSPPTVVETTEAAPPPSPVEVGDCISVDEQGNFLGIGNCNGSRGTYKVLSTDYSQGTCTDPESPYITVDGYRLCLALYLVETYCYKFPKGSGWVVAASKCKAKGTVHVIDIVPGASNGDRCTKNYKWNRWYRFTHPTVVYCVMQY